MVPTAVTKQRQVLRNQPRHALQLRRRQRAAPRWQLPSAEEASEAADEAWGGLGLENGGNTPN